MCECVCPNHSNSSTELQHQQQQQCGFTSVFPSSGTAAVTPCSCCYGGQDFSHSSSNTVDTVLSGDTMYFFSVILKTKLPSHFRTFGRRSSTVVGFLMLCWSLYSYYNNRYMFGHGDMTCVRSSKRTLKPSETKYSLGKHPNNVMPYKIIPRYGIGAANTAHRHTRLWYKKNSR